jgi:hypothetical protein
MRESKKKKSGGTGVSPVHSFKIIRRNLPHWQMPGVLSTRSQVVLGNEGELEILVKRHMEKAMKFARTIVNVLIMTILMLCFINIFYPSAGQVATGANIQTVTETKTIDVGGSGPYSKIQEAINAALPPYNYIIRVAQGTYYENLTINTSKSISLQGGWNSTFTARNIDSSNTIIDGGLKNRVIDIQALAGIIITINIEGFTISNGSAVLGGGIGAISSGAGSNISLLLQNNTIKNNMAANDGGGIWAEANGSGASTKLQLTKSQVASNLAKTGAGLAAQSIDGGQLIVEMQENSICWNTASECAGGVWLNSAHAGSLTQATLTRNDISHNSNSSLDGGGIAAYASDAGSKTVILLNNNLITKNIGNYGGGAFFYSWGKEATIDITSTNDIIAGNQGVIMFGGIGICCTDNALSSLSIVNSTIAENLSGDSAKGVWVIAGGGAFGTPVDKDTSYAYANFENSIIVGNDGLSLYSYAKSSPVVVQASYSLIKNISNYQSTYDPNYCLSSDPLFQNPANLNFLLKGGSPAIDAGNPLPAYYDGSRPPGRGTARNDLGAYGGPNNSFTWVPAPDKPIQPLLMLLLE